LALSPLESGHGNGSIGHHQPARHRPNFTHDRDGNFSITNTIVAKPLEVRFRVSMTFSFGPVPAWNAPPNEKIAYGVTLVAIIFFFSLLKRVLLGRSTPIRNASGRRPASVREIALFVALSVALWSATFGWSYLWKLLTELRNK
jgi:hypothetical protein